MTRKVSLHCVSGTCLSDKSTMLLSHENISKLPITVSESNYLPQVDVLSCINTQSVFLKSVYLDRIKLKREISDAILKQPKLL